MVELMIENRNGMKALVSSYGGRIMSLNVPDRKGVMKDVVLGYDKSGEYLSSNEKFYGAAIGRYGNRIADAKFHINGSTYQLEKNDGNNCLHGGNEGFHNVQWELNKIDSQTIELKHLSKDGDGGFPGNLSVRMIYFLSDDNELKVEYFAMADKPTIVNLTHHSFFNLTGDPEKSINGHIMQIFADHYTPVGEGLIPTGEIAPVKGTPFDFNVPVEIGRRVDENDPQLKLGRGYDHNWVLDMDPAKNKIRLAARVTEPLSGRRMEVLTNEPGIQFYGGNFLNGSDCGKNNISYNHRTAFCLETQHFPDSPNRKNFPSTLLMPGEEYYSVCIYRFSTVS
jgi:aldose 1-epimerase